MPEDSLVVEAVEIHRAPGFENEGFPVEDLSPGINIVHGPNASGKTTLAKTTQWLLWPDEAADFSRFTGYFSLDGDSWRVHVDGANPSYQRDGQDATRPTLPAKDQRDRYHLSLHDLLQHDTTNEEFAQTIKRESAGGYDIAAAVEDLGLEDTPSTRRLGVVDEVEQAFETVSEAKDTAAEHHTAENRLARLESDLEEAREAREEVQLLEKAIDFADARNELREVEENLEEYPEELAEMDGEEVEEVDALDAKIEEWESKKAEAVERRDAAREALDAADLPDGGITAEYIAELESIRDRLDSREEDLADAKAEKEKAKAERAECLEEIPLDVDEERLEDLETEVWDDLWTFLRTAESVQAKRQMKAAVEEWLGDDELPDQDPATLEAGAQHLENWLANPPDEDGGAIEAVRVATASAGIIAVLSLLLGLFVHPGLFLTLVLAAALVVYGYRLHDAAKDEGEDRKRHRTSFEESDLDPPQSWDESAVKERLKEIYDTIAAIKLQRTRIERREGYESNYDGLAEDVDALAEQRQSIREHVGGAPDDTDIELTVTARWIRDWQKLSAEVESARETIREREDQIETLQGNLESELDAFGFADVPDSSRAMKHIQELDSRREDHDEATRKLEQAKRDVLEAEEKLADFRAQRERVFTELGLDPDQRERLEELCEQVDAYEDTRQARNDAKAVFEEKEATLETEPGWEPALKEADIETLEERRRTAAETAQRYDEIQKEIATINERLREAKQGNDFEEALSEKERALDAVQEQLAEDREKVVGHALAEHLKEETREASRPPVFDRARDILTRITKGRYRIDIEEGEDTFRAYDTYKDKGFALDELSSATQLQVLLAVRIAFVEHTEQDRQLPLILDETLANTDDEKAQIIIESMVELARDGRQVFYFTAQGDEVAKWKSTLENGADVESTIIDLADIRDSDDHVVVPDLSDVSSASEPVPSPADHDHASYREELDVSPFNPRQGAGNAHLWFLVEDLDLLHQLLSYGVSHWGPLENLLSAGHLDAVVDDPATLSEIHRRGMALEEFVSSWQHGRGKLVDRQVLEETEAVTDTFIEDVTELAHDVDGTGEAIIAELREGAVNNFRSGKIDELEAYFEREGYISTTETLSDAEIHVRIVNRLLEADVSEDEATEMADTVLKRIGGGTGTISAEG